MDPVFITLENKNRRRLHYSNHVFVTYQSTIGDEDASNGRGPAGKLENVDLPGISAHAPPKGSTPLLYRPKPLKSL